MAASEPTLPESSATDHSEASETSQSSASQPALSNAAAAESPDDIEQAMKEAETTLKDLQERYAQLKAGPAHQQNLQDKIQEARQASQQVKAQIRQASNQRDRKPLSSQQSLLLNEIQALQEQLYILDIELESRIFRWFSRDKQEWFWQFLRYAGLGFGAALLLQHFLK